MKRAFLLIFLTGLAAPLAAQDSGEYRFGNDAYLAGKTVTHTGAAVDDLFIAGDAVSSNAPVTGSAHMAGRRITVTDTVGNSLYAAGMDVDITAPIGGDAMLAGETVRVAGDIGGDLRAVGSRIEVLGSVADTANLAGESVLINGVIAGDVSVSAASFEFGSDARVDGTLHLYNTHPDSIDVPAGVASADRIERHLIEDWEGVGVSDVVRVTWWSVAMRVVTCIVAVALTATALAALAPKFVVGLRTRALGAPGRAIWMGFLGLSATIGSLVVFALTGIGIVLVPVSIITALALGFAGYVIGSYVLGVGLVGLAGRGMPETLGARAVAAFVGATAAGLIALIPFLGWIFALGLILMGAGALIVRFFGPGFFTDRSTA